MSKFGRFRFINRPITSKWNSISNSGLAPSSPASFSYSNLKGIWDLKSTSLFPTPQGIYAFTTATFTTGGATGRTGPSLAQAIAGLSGAGTDTWKNNTTYFNTSSGIQLWTVPASGTYSFTIRGANGVPSSGANSGCSGGQGIILSFTANLVMGEVLRLIVGQSGTASSAHGGGGGATAVLRSPYNTTGSIIAIAGGGGGRRQSSSGPGIGGASFTTYSGYGTSNSTNSSATIGSIMANGPTGISGFTNFNGVSGGGTSLGYGGSSADNGYGDGGAGFIGNGKDDGSGSSILAQAISGAALGGGGSQGSDGGFGGGGDGAGGNGGGGGGGYTGGNGGHTAGGGGSYRDASVTNYSESFDGLVTTIGGSSTLYHGYITITKL
jgi:hypothetical protein